jgi:hypothetical protein
MKLKEIRKIGEVGPMSKRRALKACWKAEVSPDILQLFST